MTEYQAEFDEVSDALQAVPALPGFRPSTAIK